MRWRETARKPVVMVASISYEADTFTTTLNVVFTRALIIREKKKRQLELCVVLKRRVGEVDGGVRRCTYIQVSNVRMGNKLIVQDKTMQRSNFVFKN